MTDTACEYCGREWDCVSAADRCCDDIDDLAVGFWPIRTPHHLDD